MDRMLLASWVTVYSMLLWGFGILKLFEGIAEQGSVPTSPSSQSR